MTQRAASGGWLADMRRGFAFWLMKMLLRIAR